MKRINNIVQDLLLNSGITKAPVDVKKIAQSIGLTIKKFDLGDGISGALLLNNGQAVIGVNPNDSKERQRFTIAHETAHYCLHKTDTNLFVENQGKILFRDMNSSLGEIKEEREANAFAAALLMPESFLIDELDQLKSKNLNSDEAIISELAKRFQVSTITMTYRLSNLSYFH